MKFFALILSFYILFLTALPCKDVHHVYAQDLSEQLSTHRTDNNHNDNDHCSPFCTCDSCISHVIPVLETIHPECTDFTFAEFGTYSVSYCSSLFASIWQPPKIS